MPLIPGTRLMEAPINADGSKNTMHAADFDRAHGARLTEILNRSKTNGSNWFIEEGFVDIRESAGIYRSPSWDYPSQYLEIVREYLDSSTLTRRLEAEAADSFLDSTLMDGTAHSSSYHRVGRRQPTATFIENLPVASVYQRVPTKIYVRATKWPKSVRSRSSRRAIRSKMDCPRVDCGHDVPID